jgi:ABC-type multidrug transport system permease subunit
VDNMPGWLQGFARNQPVSVTAEAVRAVVSGQPAGRLVLQSVAWAVAILAIFAPIAVRLYRRKI